MINWFTEKITILKWVLVIFKKFERPSVLTLTVETRSTVLLYEGKGKICLSEEHTVSLTIIVLSLKSANELC